MNISETRHPFGTDLQIQWHLYSKGADVDLYGKPLQLTVIDPNGRHKKQPYTTNGSTLLCILYGRDQKWEGWYDLELKVNPGDVHQVCITVPHAFCLTRSECNYCQLDMAVAQFSHDLSGVETIEPLYTDKCHYGYMDGAEQEDMTDEEFMAVLQKEAALIDLDGFQALAEGDAFQGNTITFDYPKEYLWVLTPITQPDFTQAIEVSQGFVFPFEQIVTVAIGTTQYHARRSNGMNVGETVTVRFE